MHTNTCMFHGEYKGDYCPECESNFEKKFEDKSSFSHFLVKGSILLALGMGLGWYLFTL